MAAKRKITAATKNSILVGPLPPFLMGGCSDQTTIRTLLELVACARASLMDQDHFLNDSHKLAVKILKEEGKMMRANSSTFRLRLPANMEGYGDKKIWCCDSWASMASSIPLPKRPLRRE